MGVLSKLRMTLKTLFAFSSFLVYFGIGDYNLAESFESTSDEMCTDEEGFHCATDVLGAISSCLEDYLDDPEELGKCIDGLLIGNLRKCLDCICWVLYWAFGIIVHTQYC